jgi:hypothetical protein
MATTYTWWIHHGEGLEDMADEDANVHDNGVQENAILQDDGVEEIAILPDVGGVDNTNARDSGGQEMVQENQYILGMEDEDHGDGIFLN